MKISDYVSCVDFPCVEARQESYLVPDLEVNPETIKIVLISETAATSLADNYYFTCDALHARTTLQAFKEAGVTVSNTQDLLRMGIYLTTAVKCGKTDYAVSTSTIVHCSSLLEREIGLFPNVKTFLLMGDVAIKAMNTIARRQGAPRVIPAGSTYKIRGGEFSYRGARVFPSYLQAGPSFGIEKSKVRMIAEDIGVALRIADIK
ncbi:MAG TPA: uracil-DNA glycosylase family protein [Anaerolineales bacterium]|nr:uracil-DNA glycosylase family protein [Anaerolineales bacterium]